jgi:serine/threonine protein phosphatase 1
MVGRLLRRLISPTEARPQASQGSARILSLHDMPAAIYAIGDVHGCSDLYRRLEAAIVADSAALTASGPRLIVVLGDLIDRGPDSAGMIDLMLAPPPDGFTRLVLRGNHEDMMAKFLAEPARSSKWLDFGGTETLISYGLHPDPEKGFPSSTTRLSAMLEHAIPSSHRRFLADLPLALNVCGTLFCHAGIDPTRSLQDQLPEDLLWGDPARIDAMPRTDISMVVHGHVITASAHVTPGRINVDTGAYLTGILSAVRLAPGTEPFVLSVEAKTR